MKRITPSSADRSLKNVDRESLALSRHPEFLELIAQSRAQFATGREALPDEERQELAREVLPALLGRSSTP